MMQRGGDALFTRVRDAFYYEETPTARERGVRLGKFVIAAYVKRGFDIGKEWAVMFGPLSITRSSFEIQGKGYVRWTLARRTLRSLLAVLPMKGRETCQK